MYRVYVIRNPANRLYIGLSEDVDIRLAQHNSGISNFTRNKGPWVLLWTSEAMSLHDARLLENKLKKQKGGNGFWKLLDLDRLADS